MPRLFSARKPAAIARRRTDALDAVGTNSPWRRRSSAERPLTVELVVGNKSCIVCLSWMRFTLITSSTQSPRSRRGRAVVVAISQSQVSPHESLARYARTGAANLSRRCRQMSGLGEEIYRVYRLTYRRNDKTRLNSLIIFLWTRRRRGNFARIDFSGENVPSRHKLANFDVGQRRRA